MQQSGNSMGQVEMQQCIQDCLNCNTVCLESASKQSGDMANMLRDCAELCMTTAHFMQHNSPMHGYLCQTCSQVCTHCAEICEQAGDTNCANACRACAWSCDQMAKMVA